MNIRNAIATPIYLAHQASLALLHLAGAACERASAKLNAFADAANTDGSSGE